MATLCRNIFPRNILYLFILISKVLIHFMNLYFQANVLIVYYFSLSSTKVPFNAGIFKEILYKSTFLYTFHKNIAYCFSLYCKHLIHNSTSDSVETFLPRPHSPFVQICRIEVTFTSFQLRRMKPYFFSKKQFISKLIVKSHLGIH